MAKSSHLIYIRSSIPVSCREGIKNEPPSIQKVKKSFQTSLLSMIGPWSAIYSRDSFPNLPISTFFVCVSNS